MTDEKATKQILAKRPKISDKEILDATYVAYKTLTEKNPIRPSKVLSLDSAVKITWYKTGEK